MVESLSLKPPNGGRSPQPLLSRSDVSSNSAGIGLILAGVTLFSVSDVLAKQLSQTLPSPEITWLRYLMLSIVAVTLAAPRGGALLRPKQPGLQVLRGVASLGSAVFFLLSLRHMGVAEATAISFVAPALITCLSIPLLGERVRWRRWAATLVGLAGVLIVVRPGGGVFGPAALTPLASAVCGALAVVVTRRMGPGARARTTLFWSAMGGLGLLTLSAGLWFEPPTARELSIGLGMGLAYARGQLMMILAYRQGEASLLAPFTYAQILSSGFLGFIVLGAVPGAVTLVGMAVILLSGAYTLHRERAVRRAT
jgi:drug/metabolite transporter (DMT)-like permease